MNKLLQIRSFCTPDGVLGTCPSDATWTEWFNQNSPSRKGDFESLKKLKKRGKVCPSPRAMQVLTTNNESYKSTRQRVFLDLSKGVWCESTKRSKCFDYKVRYCCQSPGYQKNMAEVTTSAGPGHGKLPISFLQVLDLKLLVIAALFIFCIVIVTSLFTNTKFKMKSFHGPKHGRCY